MLTSSLKIKPSMLGLQNTSNGSLHRSKTLDNEYPGYDIKQAYGEDPALELKTILVLATILKGDQKTPFQ